MLYENDQFLLELTKLFQQQRVKNSGSLCLTMKRYDGRVKPKSQLTKKQRLEQKKNPSLSNAPTTSSTETIEYKCLVRANFGSKKLSTVVSSKDINRFQLAYANLLKVNMDTLKKKAKESKTPSTNTNPLPSSPATTTSNPSKAPMSPLATPHSPSSTTPKKTTSTSAKKK